MNVLKSIGQRQHNKPQDLDQPEVPGFMGELEARLRDSGHQPLPPNQAPTNYAPRVTRVADELMDGKDELLAEMKKTIENIRTIVRREITAMRAELDKLETVVDQSTEATSNALENQLNIAAHARVHCAQIKEKIESFGSTVANTLPK